MKILNIFKKKKPVEVKLELPSQSEISDILDTIREYKSYYTGGTLCVDGLTKTRDVLMMNLDGEYFWFVDGTRGELDFENRKKLFQIYMKCKGETPHYQHQWANFDV